MKKIIIIAVAFIIFISGTLTGLCATAGIKVVVNGNQLDTDAKLIDNRVYVPTRAVSESLGASVNWDAASQTVSITKQSSNNDDIIPDIIKNVSSSVVGIIGNWKGSGSYTPNSYSDSIVHGSGFIIKADGDIMTNAHVVNEMDRIIVVLYDGSSYEAKLKYIDVETDLAVVHIDKTGLQPVKLGKEEDIVVGKTVIAIGTPISFSLRNSSSVGVISGLNRGSVGSYALIQTDAAINPGNSGGPLIDLKGEVIGVNSAKYVGEAVEGMGFSIPLGTINYVLDQFNKYGKVRRPYLGATFNESFAAMLGMPNNDGLTIKHIDNNSPAREQGLKVDDVLLSINNINVNTIVDYNEEMKKYLPKDKVTLKIRRDDKIQDFSIIMGEEN